MAQTGDVQYGNMESNFDIRMAGRGGSEFSDVKAEFSGILMIGVLLVQPEVRTQIVQTANFL